VNGIAFANTGANGAADDIQLGSGTFVSGSAGLDPATGNRTTHFVENFLPTDQDGLSPLVHSPALFDFLNTGPASLLVNTPQPDGTILQTLNGGTGEAKSVPEIGDGATILVSNIPPHFLHHPLEFIYGRSPHGRAFDG
jgi:hypothetical protein